MKNCEMEIKVWHAKGSEMMFASNNQVIRSMLDGDHDLVATISVPDDLDSLSPLEFAFDETQNSESKSNGFRSTMPGDIFEVIINGDDLLFSDYVVRGTGFEWLDVDGYHDAMRKKYLEKIAKRD